MLTTNDSFLDAKYQERNSRMLADSGARFAGSVQVVVSKQVGEAQVAKNRLELQDAARVLAAQLRRQLPLE